MRSTLSLLAEYHQRQADQHRRLLLQRRLAEGDPLVCRATGEEHCLVTFHSRPPAERLVCIDCGVTFSHHDDLLTRPHGRSKM